MKHILNFLLLLGLMFSCMGQSRIDPVNNYEKAFTELTSLAAANQPQTFKKAVFITENVFLKDSLNYESLNKAYHQLGNIALEWSKANRNPDYASADSQQISLNKAVFQLIKDTLLIERHGLIFNLLPFEYNFDDYNGKIEWENTFVYTLLSTHKGNCHSLPYLYKIIADEIGTQCWLSLAPNHMYVKNYSKRDGWFNTELTSGTFPTDAWLNTTGYISLNSVRNGLYCDTLSNQQSIALCSVDLARCYERETHNYYDGFILKCCDLTLKYHPVNVQALLLKAETQKRIYEKKKKAGDIDSLAIYEQMEKLFVCLYDLGYREMPEKMYKEWLLTLKNQKAIKN